MDYSSEEEFDNYIHDRLVQQRTITTRKVVRDFQNPFDYYSSEEFRRRYRFSKDIVYNVILPMIISDLSKLTRRGLPVLPIYQLLVALRFYASGSFQNMGIISFIVVSAVGGVGLMTGGAAVVAPLLGFTSTGVAAGTVAASAQSFVGNVAAGSIFAKLTSLAML